MSRIALWAFAYLFGGIPWAYLLTRLIKHQDIRDIGSGNVGATNAFRAGGWQVGVPTLLLDIFKGAFPTYLGLYFFDLNTALVAGIFAVLGHTFTPFLRFRGGKGVATAVGAFSILAPVPLALGILIWIAILLIFRYVSLASMLGALAVAVSVPFFVQDPLLTVATAFTALVIIVRHHGNIRRLIRGEEPKVQWKKP